MTHGEFEDQAEAAFDPSTGGEARARLAQLASADPGLRERWDDLEPALEALQGARLEPLPEGLHDRLIAAARTSAPGERRGSGSWSWLSFFTAAIQARPAYALGGAVAAGIAIGALGLALIFGSARNAGDLSSGTSASLPPVGSASVTTIDLGGSRVMMEARSAEGGFVVRVGDARGDASALTLAWDPARLQLTGVRWGTSTSPAFETRAGYARLPLPASVGSELSWRGNAGGSEVRVTLSAPNGEKEASLRLP